MEPKAFLAMEWWMGPRRMGQDIALRLKGSFPELAVLDRPWKRGMMIHTCSPIFLCLGS